MANLVVGEGLLELEIVVRAIEDSKSFEVLLQSWKRFSRNLISNQVNILIWNRRLIQETLDLGDLLREILRAWKAEKGSQGTLDALCKALDDCGVHDISESLKTVYGHHKEPTLPNIKFLWKENVVSLKELLKENISERICMDLLNAVFNLLNLLKNKLQEPIKLLKDQTTPPTQPKYYIPRTLHHFPSTELDKNIFTSESSKTHVFLFEGISKSDLAKLSEYQAIEYSGNQRYRVSVRFILLECDGDFESICAKTNNPVHLIQVRAGNYFWKRSSGGLNVILKFLKEPGKSISEQEMASKITALTPPFASIADSPGMGKTLVLGNLAEHCQKEQRSIVLFIVLQEFVEQIGFMKGESSAIEAIVEYASCNYVAKIVLTEMLKLSEDYQLNLFLDGYDEVMEDKLYVLESFLKNLKALKKVKVVVVVTTRPHLQTRLEVTLEQLSFELLPFTQSNQIEFLTRYWSNQLGTKEEKRLEEFAQKCLETLEKKLTDKNKIIAGIPLQCMMLAEVFAEDAQRALHLETLRDDVIEPISFFWMYERLVEIKFARIPDQGLREKYQKAHVHLAINLLFPEWSKKFKNILNDDGEINSFTLYSIGLIEKSPRSIAPRFIHRTFAEYLLAEFVVKNLGKYYDCVLLLFGEIFGCSFITVRRDWNTLCGMKFPVIGHFVEMQLKEYVSNHKPHEGLFHPLSNYDTKLLAEDICATIAACCSNDLEHLFDYSVKMLNKYSIGQDLEDKYFKDLPHIVVQNSMNLILLEKVLEFTPYKFNVDIVNMTNQNAHTTNYWDLVDLDRALVTTNYTPLHDAVHFGKFNMVTMLINHFEKVNCPITNFKYLLHYACHNSKSDSEEVLNNKLLIIDMLVGINRDWLEEENRSQCTPLLSNDVHFKLLERLVQLGANINVRGRSEGTVLHSAAKHYGCCTSYTELVRWAFLNGFNLFSQINCYSRSPLMHAVKTLGSVEDEVLEMFILNCKEVDLNAQDCYGDTILLLALERVESPEFIYKLLELGASVYVRNKNNENALHKLMYEGGCIQSKLEILDKLVGINREWMEEKDKTHRTPLLQQGAHLNLVQRLVEHGADINAPSSSSDGRSFLRTKEGVVWALSHGFIKVNDTDKRKRTLIMQYMRCIGSPDYEILQLFQKAGADFSANDRNGDSVLFYFLKLTPINISLLDEVLQFVTDINHTNKRGRNAAHIVMFKYHLDAEHKVEILKLLEAKGFNGFNQKDLDGKTPIARTNGRLSKNLLLFFQERANKFYVAY